MTNIKVGDKVRVKMQDNTGFWTRLRDKQGTVISMTTTTATVQFDGETDTGELNGLELVAPAPAIPDEIEINGAKYRRVIEEAAPEKPEPKAGQVWRDGEARICILTMENKNTHLKDGGAGSWGRDGFARKGTFIAPSLADALERGLITAADLR